jgi:alpha-1,2-mannosyltransferase
MQETERRYLRGPWSRRVLIGLTLIGFAIISAEIERGRVGNTEWTTSDLHVYWAASKAVLTGHGIYSALVPTGMTPGFCRVVNCPVTMGFVYPPFAALLLAPISLLSLSALRLAWFSVIFVCLEGVVWLSLGWAGVRNQVIRLTAAVAAAAVLPFFDPVRQEFLAGQVNVFLMLLLLADMRRRDGAPGKGIGVGIAAGFKLTPLIFVLFLAFTRRFKAARTAVVVFVATVVAGFIVRPSDSWHYWTSYVAQTQRIYPESGIVYNQSLRAVLARLLHDNDPTAAYVPISIVALIAGITVAVLLHRRNLEFEAVLACAFTAVLVSPVAWVYHWVWFVPLLIIMAVRAARSPSVGAALGWATLTVAAAVIPSIHLYTWLPWYQQPSGAWQQLESDSLALSGLVLLLLGLLLALRSPDGTVSSRAAVSVAAEVAPESVEAVTTAATSAAAAEATSKVASKDRESSPPR